ncbi:sugar-binding domain-containing protein [Limibacter armeniacum]|uniref:glycoside hydrolase family 2 protein n=1 Tax=Limibacter armeniacum TaxID=466084 RepID=UPI002FE5D45C
MKLRKSALLVLMACLSATGLQAQKKQDVLQYSMQTKWAKEVDPQNVRPEYPRPQMTRDNWENLNGYWEYAIESKGKGKPSKFDGNILVPFAVESELSQVKKMVGQENYLWYKRTFTAKKNNKERVLLHFDAVDWEATVFLNGKEIGVHRGGFDPFEFDITAYLKEGEQELLVRVWDPTDQDTQARGKQSATPRGIWYTPVTGIWQTVWLETVPMDYVKRINTRPDIDQRQAAVKMEFSPLSKDLNLVVTAKVEGKTVNVQTTALKVGSSQAEIDLNIADPKLWSPENPFLYDMEIALQDEKGNTIDKVGSYFGMRKISLGKDANGYTRIMLNNEPVFHWGLLDQGWWPDGLYTAPTEEAMLYDVKVTRDMGFNMIRKHVKVEPARYYYHCDKMGVLVWQDMPNGNYLKELRVEAWEKDVKRPKESAVQFESELKEMMDDFGTFPSIVVWVPFNEGWGQYDTERIAEWVKNYDPTRICDAPSGWADRGVGDLVDIHLYPGPGMEPAEKNRASVLGEFGGLGWPVENHLWWNKKNWGYLTYNSQEVFTDEFSRIVEELQPLVGWGLSAAVYTQTTDVEGEVNGLMTYDREVIKVNPAEIKKLSAKLYQPWWNKQMLVADSETERQEWMVTESKPAKNWMATDYDDFFWMKKEGPFSTEEMYTLEASTGWDSDKLYARKKFYLSQLPQHLYIKHYLPKAKVKIYVNGHEIKTIEDKGGRKRHYSHELFNEAIKYLKEGENVLAVEVENGKEKAAFDLGLYTSEVMIPLSPDTAAN